MQPQRQTRGIEDVLHRAHLVGVAIVRTAIVGTAIVGIATVSTDERPHGVDLRRHMTCRA